MRAAYRLSTAEELAESLRLLREKHDDRLRESPDARRFMHALYGVGWEPSCMDPECICQGATVRS